MTSMTVDDMGPRAQEALASSPIYELRNLKIRQSGQTLVISGTVSSFYHKQSAQEVVRSVCVGVEVVNLIRVP